MDPMKAHIDHLLIVDDDPDIRQLLADYLQAAGFRTSLAADGREMRKRLEECVIDLVVLDVMLPGEDGLALCRGIRARSTLPIIMLTARGELLDRVIGLEMGADDYLPKPFDPRELLARIKSVLNRTRTFPDHNRPDDTCALAFEGWVLDTRTRQLRSPAGLIVSLGNSDFRVLRLLLEHPNRPLSRDFLLSQVFGKERSPFDRSIDVCISRLRQHLEPNPRTPQLIRTVRNEGYMLTAGRIEKQA